MPQTTKASTAKQHLYKSKSTLSPEPALKNIALRHFVFLTPFETVVVGTKYRTRHQTGDAKLNKLDSRWPSIEPDW